MVHRPTLGGRAKSDLNLGRMELELTVTGFSDPWSLLLWVCLSPIFFLQTCYLAANVVTGGSQIPLQSTGSRPLLVQGQKFPEHLGSRAERTPIHISTRRCAWWLGGKSISRKKQGRRLGKHGGALSGPRVAPEDQIQVF